MTTKDYPSSPDEHSYAFDLVELKACCKKRGPAYKEPTFWEAQTSFAAEKAADKSPSNRRTIQRS